ncbi:LCP family protein [Ornithinimicrobium sufpigmenti]|uniref:LCP family protein n=1 Tax=Ornithinimicrobium sufpigmenti TaxID=2508882 RepID=UPI0015E18CAB|nr:MULTISPECIES: LCP family protein [unclassified Ornithinimicrobium]
MRSRLLPALLGGLLVLTGCSGGDATEEESSAPVVRTSDPAPAAPTTDDATTQTGAPGDDAARTSAAPTATENAGATADATGQSGGSDDSEDADDSEEAAPALPEGPVNVLLIGTDSRDPDSMDGNADTILLAHLPSDRSSIGLVSLTRDMWVPIPGAGEGKINSAFPIGGTPLLTETVSELLGGLDIDYTVQSNMNAFVNLTRWLEGFEVDNQYATEVTVESTGRRVVFEEGPIWLENTDALIYARQRQGMPLGDLDRTERQRAVLVGMMHRLQERLEEDPDAFPELVANLYGNVRVTGELEVEDLLTLAPLLRDLDPDDAYSLMVPITGFDMIGGQSVNVVDREGTAALGRALREDDLAGYVERHGTSYAP